MIIIVIIVIIMITLIPALIMPLIPNTTTIRMISLMKTYLEREVL